MEVEQPCSDAQVAAECVLCPHSTEGSPQFGLWQTRCSSFLSSLVPPNHHLIPTHKPFVCSCSQEHESSIRKPINIESMHYRKLSLFKASLGLLVLWTYQVNSFLDMTKCCPLAPVINAVVPWWLCSREDERCPVLPPPPGHMWPWHQVTNPYV